jgi:hypothetical protein
MRNMTVTFAILVLLGVSTGALADSNGPAGCPQTIAEKEFAASGGKLVPRQAPHFRALVLGCASGCSGGVVVSSTVFVDGSVTNVQVVEDTFSTSVQKKVEDWAKEQVSGLSYVAPILNGQPLCIIHETKIDFSTH